jgi:hypothetical protein
MDRTMDRTLARRSLAAAAVVGVVAQGLLVGARLGINAPILVIATLAAATVLADGGRRMDPIDLWVPIAAIATSAGIALRSDEMLVFLDAMTSATLLAASMAALAGAAVTRRSAIAITALGAVVLGFVLAGVLRLVYVAGRSNPSEDPRSRIPDGVRPVVRGLLIAVPILAAFIVLFASADEIFATLAERLFNWQIDLGALPIRAGLAFVIAWLVGGLLTVAIRGIAGLRESPQPKPQMQSLGAAVVEPIQPLLRLGATEAVTILVAVDLLFAIFVSLQVAYLFGGLDTLAAGGITYANYARRGFFELVAVTCLAGGLVVGLHAIVDRRSRAFVGAAVALALLTFVVLASAALRLRLYQDAYGWTELRFYIYATIGWLGIGIVSTTILLVRDRMRWVPHAMTISAVAILLAVNVVGPQRHVADENVARLLDPTRVPPDGQIGLDVSYARHLTDDAVPALVAALPALGGEDRASLTAALEARWQRLQRPEASTWPAWNLARERAREALEPLFAVQSR